MKKLIIITIMAVGSLGVTEAEAQYVEKIGTNIFIDVRDMPSGTWSNSSLNSDHTENSSINTLFWRFEVAKSDEPGTKTWNAAKVACAAKGAGWRLPNQKEFQLVLIMKEMLILAGMNPFAAGALYFTSTTSSTNNADAFFSYINDSSMASIAKVNSLNIRCIREA